MSTFRLKSSMVATAIGTTLVLAAFAANSMTQPQDVAAVKGDRLTLPMNVSCAGPCLGAEERIEAAFETIAEHDLDAGVTVLMRVPRSVN